MKTRIADMECHVAALVVVSGARVVAGGPATPAVLIPKAVDSVVVADGSYAVEAD